MLALVAQERGRGVAESGGLRFESSGDRIQLFVTNDDPETLARLRRTEDADAFDVIKVARGYGEMLALRDRIRSDQRWLEARGLDPVAWGPSLENNGAFVALARVPAGAQDIVDSRYGAGAVLVESGQPIKPFASRLVDNAPWNGGDFIATDRLNSGCSSGPPVRSASGQSFFVTAGHCFAHAGERVLNGSHGHLGDNPRLMGSIARLEAPGSGYEGALVAANTSNRNWRTGTPSATSPSAYQYEARGSVVGTSVCMSGAYSGERCGGVVRRVNVDGEVSGNSGFLQNMVLAVHANPTIAIAGPGDSGGPIYSVQSAGLLIQGVIIGGPSSTSTLACPNDSTMIATSRRGNRCSASVWYHDAVSLFTHMGVSLKR